MLSDESGHRKARSASVELAAGPALQLSPHTHLTNLVSWATHLYLSPEHDLFRIHNPFPPDITTRRSSATCQLPKSTCYLATIMEASSKECSLFSPRMAMISHEHSGAKSDACPCLLAKYHYQTRDEEEEEEGSSCTTGWKDRTGCKQNSV